MSDPAEDLSRNNPAVTRPAATKLPAPAARNRPTSSRTSSHSSTPTQFASPSPTTLALPPRDAQDTRPPSKYDTGWRRIIRNFSPSWFSITMGTGIVSIIFISIPWQSYQDWLWYLSLIFFLLNTVLFALAFLTSLLRYTLYPEIWGVMIRDPVNSLFLATIPMGFATLIEGWVFLLVPRWGVWARYVAWGAWMADAVLAFSLTAFLSFMLLSQERTGTSLQRITAAQLLPIAATLVAAGTGAEVAAILPGKEMQLGTILCCYFMWGAGMPLALTVIVVYYQRLAVHKLPAREIIVSSFLPLGPLGFGGYGIMYMGKVALTLFPETGTLHPLAGPILYCLGVMIALVFFGFATMWLIFALAAISTAHPFPFNMGWWAFTFPSGVLACSVIQIGNELPSAAFKGIGTALGVATILLWCVVAAGTLKGAWSGKLFHAPCLANLKMREEEEERQRKESDGKAV